MSGRLGISPFVITEGRLEDRAPQLRPTGEKTVDACPCDFIPFHPFGKGNAENLGVATECCWTLLALFAVLYFLGRRLIVSIGAKKLLHDFYVSLSLFFLWG